MAQAGDASNIDTTKLNRLEIIEHREGHSNYGRTVIVTPTSKNPDITLSVQDDGKTLKVFISDRGEVS